MTVWIVFTDKVEGVFAEETMGLRFINQTWPDAEQVDDKTWVDGPVTITLEEFDVVE